MKLKLDRPQEWPSETIQSFFVYDILSTTENYITRLEPAGVYQLYNAVCFCRHFQEQSLNPWFKVFKGRYT